jgi:hypothetical protein
MKKKERPRESGKKSVVPFPGDGRKGRGLFILGHLIGMVTNNLK